ncbi:uncharacterized protein [Nicotiana tomentosiformis]|uniref:uncharacterized protein n=1 Tax=Nicotiana tomentosiformis TaxID=4098 RepID=UPI00388C38CB
MVIDEATSDDTLYNSVVYASSAQNVWRNLKERFDKRNISRIYNLLQEIAALKQGLSHISTYYSKLKDLWDEYDVMAPTPLCPCPESKVFLEHIQQQCLVQFLSGLNESFAQAKGQIMLMIPTPTINEAYGVVVQDESQRAKTMNINGLKWELQLWHTTQDKDFLVATSRKLRVKQDRWITDSGAFNHMVSSLEFFTDFMEIPKGEGRKVQLPTGETSRITHLGSSSILNGLPIKNVLYDICNGKVKGIGKLEEGLYVLDLKHKSNRKLQLNVTLDHLGVFGCLAYATNLKRQHKFSPRAVPAVFLGYTLVQKGYKLYDLHNHRPFVSRDVIFKETVFPFLQHMNKPMKDHKFPVITPVYDSNSNDPVLPPPHHSTTSQDTSSPDLEHLDDSVAFTQPHISLTNDLQGSSTSHTTPILFSDDLQGSPASHITLIPFTDALP